MVSFVEQDGIVGHDRMTLRAAATGFPRRSRGVSPWDARTGCHAREVSRPPVVPADPDLLAARAASFTGARRTLLGITGAPGAGKSTIAARLCAAVPDSVVVPMDGFHLRTADLDRLGRTDRRGAPDTFDADGFVALLGELRTATADIAAPGFDRTIEEPVPGAVLVCATTRLVIVEGNYLLLDEPPWSRVVELLDAVWFVEIPEPTRVQRLVARFVAYGMDPAAAQQRVEHGSDARNAELVAASRHRADLIIAAAS